MQSRVFQSQTPGAALERGYPAPAMSVALSHVLADQGESFERVLDGRDDSYGIAAITVAAIRRVSPPLGIQVAPEMDAPWHAIVFNPANLKISKPQRLGMRDAAELIRTPRRI